jgi:hypothetical protein
MASSEEHKVSVLTKEMLEIELSRKLGCVGGSAKLHTGPTLPVQL